MQTGGGTIQLPQVCHDGPVQSQLLVRIAVAAHPRRRGRLVLLGDIVPQPQDPGRVRRIVREQTRLGQLEPAERGIGPVEDDGAAA